MIEWIKILILAIVQGIAEWLPISSSGHLVLFQHILNFEGNLVFDVALHFGTLMAVFVYFGRDIVDILNALIRGQWKSENGKLGLLILVSTIPAAIIGYVFNKYFEAAFGSLGLVALGFAITGVSLFIASLDFKSNKLKLPSYLGALGIGFSQAVAIFPGISRSGSTISAGLISGLDERSALKFSFLMSIPVIFGAGMLEIGNNSLAPNLIWATLVAFVAGLLSIHFLFKVLSKSKKNLRWFGAYAILIALVTGVLFFFGIL